LALHLIGTPEQDQLFDDGTRDLKVPVRLKGIELDRSRQFGDVSLALAVARHGIGGALRAIAAVGQGTGLLGVDRRGSGFGAAV
jgi:hypothetical protein